MVMICREEVPRSVDMLRQIATKRRGSSRLTCGGPGRSADARRRAARTLHRYGSSNLLCGVLESSPHGCVWPHLAVVVRPRLLSKFLNAGWILQEL